MMKRLRLLSKILLALALLMAFWFFLVHWVMPAPKSKMAAYSGAPLAAYMDNAYAIQYDEQGNRKEEVFMDHWHHQLNSQQSQFEQVHVMVYQPNGTRWDIRAAHGIGYHSDLATALEFIQLNEHVHIDAIPHGTSAALWQMDTEELFVYPKFAQTQAAIQVHGPNGAQLDAIGLNAQWDKDYVEFLENVRATYRLDTPNSSAL
ncbi:MAG: LPS export ABC transporter periplasmic protein LptC [Pseudomonadota bacterium]